MIQSYFIRFTILYLNIHSFNINYSTFAIDVNATQKSKMGTQCSGSRIECPWDTCNAGGCQNGCASSICTMKACDDDNKDENQLCDLKQSNCKGGLICVDQLDGCDNGIGKCEYLVS